MEIKEYSFAYFNHNIAVLKMLYCQTSVMDVTRTNALHRSIHTQPYGTLHI